MAGKVHPLPSVPEDTPPPGIYNEPELREQDRDIRHFNPELSETDREILASLPSSLTRRSSRGTVLGRRRLSSVRRMSRRMSQKLSLPPSPDPDAMMMQEARGGRRDTIILLEKAQKKGLKMDFDSDGDYDTLDRMKQLDVIKQMPVPVAKKRRLRDKLLQEMPELESAGCEAFVYRQKLNFFRWKLRAGIQWRELAASLTMWGGAFKVVEGHFGSGVLAYFRLLKSLFQLNLLIFLMVLLFIIIPQAAFPSQDYSAVITGANSTGSVNLSLYCSTLYDVNVSSDALQTIVDFLQGTGWMEQTAMFYGDYSDREMAVTGTSFNYNMPLAYLLVTAAYFVFSLFAMIRTATAVIRMRQFATEDSMKQFCNKVFAGWDYGLSDPHNSSIKLKNIYREFQCSMEEERQLWRRRGRSLGEKCGIFLVRLLINVFILALLGGAGYLIYYTTIKTTELEDDADYHDMHPIMQLLVEYMTSLTITGLNSLLPVIFKKLAVLEDYTPAFEVNMNLLRTVFLKLASLGMLIISLITTINCTPKDVCNVGTGNCVSLRCWETKIGQELYKLIIVDFFAVVFVTFFVEFPRKLVVTRCEAKIFKMVGEQEFDIPKNLLDLIYQQVLLWLGIFFAPLIAAVTVIKGFIIFYIKMMTVMFNCRPSTKAHRGADSVAFFMGVLILAYMLCAVPIVYLVWYVTPSKGCGPFRVHDKMYEVIPCTLATWPQWLQDILDFTASAAMLIPAFITLALVIYYFKRLMSGYRQMIGLLREQLSLEGLDKQFLLSRIRELQASESGKPQGGARGGNRPTTIREESDVDRLDTPPNVPLDSV